MTHRNAVPCNGCTICCEHDLIMLHPEHGDLPDAYEHELTVSPLTGRWGLSLKHKPDGSCIYLGAAGCTIHDRAPVICREFDCRRFYRDVFMKQDRPERRRWLANGLISKDLIEAGKARLPTLEKGEAYYEPDR